MKRNKMLFMGMMALGICGLTSCNLDETPESLSAQTK